jgi:hypothetical protein
MNANDKWKKDNTRIVTLRLNNNTDAEIIRWIDELKTAKVSVNGEIKKAIITYLGGGKNV